MMKAAVISSDNIVVNIIVWSEDSIWNGEGQAIPFADDAFVDIGCRWDGNAFIPKPQVPLPELTYQEKRILEYPTIGDQLDALFHAGLFPLEMAAMLQAVKDKYPKGSA